MKAVRFHQHGGPDVLRYEEAPDPVLAPGEVLVRVRACALNHLDLWARRGLPSVRIPMPHISRQRRRRRSGRASTAADVAIGQPRDAAARAELRPVRCVPVGRDNECARYEVLGYTQSRRRVRRARQGAGRRTWSRSPTRSISSHAAAFPLTFLTAWHMLMTRARLKRGEDVLVLAAGSGVGQAAIQIAVAARRARLRHGRVARKAGTRARARRLAVIHHHTAGYCRGNQAADEPAGRRCRHRTCRRGHLAARACARWPGAGGW